MSQKTTIQVKFNFLIFLLIQFFFLTKSNKVLKRLIYVFKNKLFIASEIGIYCLTKLRHRKNNIKTDALPQNSRKVTLFFPLVKVNLLKFCLFTFSKNPKKKGGMDKFFVFF